MGERERERERGGVGEGGRVGEREREDPSTCNMYTCVYCVIGTYKSQYNVHASLTCNSLVLIIYIAQKIELQ